MNFYACKVTMQNALGHSAVFETFAIASNPDEAADAADKAATEQVLLTGWLITNTFAKVVATEMLEEVAEKVLGWSRRSRP